MMNISKKEVILQLNIENVEQPINEKQIQRAEKISVISNWFRLKFHSIFATILIALNIVFLVPLSFFTWFSTIMGSFAFRWLIDISWPAFISLWLLPLITWHYSTVTIPIKKGHKYVIDWSDRKKGRFLSMVLNLTAFHFMSWVAAAKYTTMNYFNYLSSVRVPKEIEGTLLVDDLHSFILIIYFVPVILSGIIIFGQIRDYQINRDLLVDKLWNWESPFFTRFVHNADINACDIIIGYDAKTKKPLVIKEDQRFLHEGSFGPTGSGKTSTSILLRIAQDLIKIRTGRRKMGLVFLEPKGDGVDDVLTLCKKLGIPNNKIRVIDPTKSFSIKYNPFSGPLEAAASAFSGTIDALTGDQDEFFKGQQNEAAKTYTLLAKIRYGNLTNITHIQRMFQDPRYLADIVEEVREQIDTKRRNKDNSPEVLSLLESWERIVRYFENDILDYKTYRDKESIKPMLYPSGHQYEGEQVVENKKDKFVTGAKQYLNDIALNAYLSSLFVSNEDEEVFDADEFLKEGGVLLINTALAELEELSLIFGQFFIRQFQSAVFRRPKEGRIPIFFYVDEFPLYANEAFERFLTLGRSYKVGTLIAMQSLGQLDKIIDGFRETVLSNSSSKTVFGRGTVADNEYYSKEFGEKLVVEESLNESSSPMTVESNTWGFRMNTQKKLAPRFTPSEIRELPFKQMVVQVVDENNSIDISTKAIGKFVHEARFIKRYLTINPEEIKSTNEREFEIDKMLDDKGLKVLEGIVSQLEEETTSSKIKSADNVTSKEEDLSLQTIDSEGEQIQEILNMNMDMNQLNQALDEENKKLFEANEEIIIPDDEPGTNNNDVGREKVIHEAAAPMEEPQPVYEQGNTIAEVEPLYVETEPIEEPEYMYEEVAPIEEDEPMYEETAPHQEPEQISESETDELPIEFAFEEIPEDIAIPNSIPSEEAVKNIENLVQNINSSLPQEEEILNDSAKQPIESEVAAALEALQLDVHNEEAQQEPKTNSSTQKKSNYKKVTAFHDDDF